MKIAIVTECLGSFISGGLLCIVSVLNELVAQGHEVCLFLKSKPYRSEWLGCNFPIYPTDSATFEEFDGYLVSSFAPVSKLVAEHKASASRYLWMHTDEGNFDWNGTEWRDMARNSYQLPLKIFCTSNYVRTILEKVYHRKAIGQLVPPGIDPNVFNLNDHVSNWDLYQPLRIGIFGRTHPIRGLDIAQKAIQVFSSEHPIQIIMIPDGIQDRADLAAYYKKMDIFIDASRYSGSAVPPREAMACGAVVISTPMGTIDIILDRFNGYIVPVDDPIAIVEALREYVQSSVNNRRDMSNRCWEIMFHYSWDRIAKKFIKAIEEGK